MADSPAPHPARERGRAPTRRAVLAGGVAGAAGVVLSACSSDEDPGSREPASPAGLAPDVAVATRALAEIQAVREAVAATVKRFPASPPEIGSLVALHKTHEATLVDAVPERARPSTAPAPYVVPRKREKALSVLATREQRLHDTLDGLALRAQSGQFARLLASMGSSLHQRLATWPA